MSNDFIVNIVSTVDNNDKSNDLITQYKSPCAVLSVVLKVLPDLHAQWYGDSASLHLARIQLFPELVVLASELALCSKDLENNGVRVTFSSSAVLCLICEIQIFGFCRWQICE